MSPRPRRWLALALIVLALRPLAAFAEDIPHDKLPAILLRILAYDRRLEARASGPIVRIAVVHPRRDAEAVRRAGELARAMTEYVSRTTIHDRKLALVLVPYDRRTFGADLAASGASVAYVTAGLTAECEAIAPVTRTRRVLTFTGEEDGVRRGLSIGVVRRGERAAILINLSAARAEGAELAAGLLRVAEVVKR